MGRSESASSDDFANAFESAFASLQIRVETACAADIEWQERVAEGIRVALAFATAHPDAARVLTSKAMEGGKEGVERYDRMIGHFAKGLQPGRTLRPEGEYLPEVTEKLMVGGLAALIAHRIDNDRHAELSELAPEAIQFVLTPYLGTEEAKRVASRGSG